MSYPNLRGPKHLANLQEERLQYAAMGYTVYRQCINVTDDTLGIRIAQEVIEQQGTGGHCSRSTAQRQSLGCV